MKVVWCECWWCVVSLLLFSGWFVGCSMVMLVCGMFVLGGLIVLGVFM